MPAWRVYYGDFSTFDSDDGGPDRAPATGVVAIAQPPTRGPRAEFDSDFYWWHHGLERWVGGDIYGRLQHELAPGWKRVLMGETVEPDVYNRIVNAALADPDFAD